MKAKKFKNDQDKILLQAINDKNVHRKRYSAVLTFNLKCEKKTKDSSEENNVFKFQEREDTEYEYVEVNEKKVKAYKGLKRIISTPNGLESLKMITRGNIKFSDFSTFKHWLRDEHKSKTTIDYEDLFVFKDVQVERLYFCSSVQEIYTYLFLFNWHYFDIEKVSREKRFLPLRKKLLKNISALLGEYKGIKHLGEALEKKLKEKNAEGKGKDKRISIAHEFFYSFRIPEDFFVEKAIFGYNDTNMEVLKIELKMSTKANVVMVVKSLKSTFYGIFGIDCFKPREYTFRIGKLTKKKVDEFAEEAS